MGGAYNAALGVGGLGALAGKFIPAVGNAFKGAAGVAADAPAAIVAYLQRQAAVAGISASIELGIAIEAAELGTAAAGSAIVAGGVAGAATAAGVAATVIGAVATAVGVGLFILGAVCDIASYTPTAIKNLGGTPPSCLPQTGACDDFTADDGCYGFGGLSG